VVASGGGLIGDSCVVYKEEGINLGVGLQKKVNSIRSIMKTQGTDEQHKWERVTRMSTTELSSTHTCWFALPSMFVNPLL
jgi:hypothetical protein